LYTFSLSGSESQELRKKEERKKKEEERKKKERRKKEERKKFIYLLFSKTFL
jgi:hypothetical protein